MLPAKAHRPVQLHRKLRGGNRGGMPLERGGMNRQRAEASGISRCLAGVGANSGPQQLARVGQRNEGVGQFSHAGLATAHVGRDLVAAQAGVQGPQSENKPT